VSGGERRELLDAVNQSDFVDDADYGGVDGRIGAADGGHCGEAFGGEQDAFADSGVNGVECDDGFAAIGAIEIERLDHQKLTADVRGIFLSGDYVADDARDEHLWLTGFRGNVDFVNDADDCGFGGNFDGEKREAGFFAAAPVDRFAGAGAD
jgi:hypothetical protein